MALAGCASAAEPVEVVEARQARARIGALFVLLLVFYTKTYTFTKKNTVMPLSTPTLPLRSLYMLVLVLFALSCDDNKVEAPQTFTVSFNPNGGSTVASRTVTKDEKVAQPTDPEKEGYTFAGWYTDEATTQAYDFATPVTANITLYAKWAVGAANNTEQRYTVAITYNWNATDHGPLPSTGHFTTFFAAIHNNQFLLYKRGSQLGAGMQVLAETGGTTTLADEIKDNANVLSSSTVGGQGGAQNTFSLDVVVTTQHPYISMATMIAPSPDWFIGVSSILLYENGAFKNTVSGGMNAYDGGTEEGTEFQLTNLPTTPKEPVTLLQSMNGVALDNTNKPLATYTIAKKD